MAGEHPPIDPELQAVMQLLRDEYRDGSWTLDKLATLRDLWKRYAPDEDALTLGGKLHVAELVVPASDTGPELAMLMIGPSGGTSRPCLFHIHGGGMIAGDSRAGVSYLVDYAARYQAVIASIEYRLAPEHPFPAAVDDCFRGFCWLVENAAALGLDPDRIVITGASAGGGLAAATSLRARDSGGPCPSHQMLLSPMIDDRENTPSSSFAGIPWDAVSNRTGWSALLGPSARGPEVSPYAAVARATDLRGMPRSYIEVGEVEVFRDEALALAGQLMTDGVPCELHVWAGATHGFDSYAPHATVSQAAIAARDSFFHRVLAP